MPERNLVASLRSQHKPSQQFGYLVAVICACCFAISSGCSNLRPNSLDTPLPVPPSQAAQAKKIEQRQQQDTPTDRSNTSVAKRTINDLLPPTTSATGSPDAKIIGVYEKEDMPELKLKAIASKPPAPAIALATHQSAIDDEQVTKHEHDANCDCQKKKTPPKLAKVEPIDPESIFAIDTKTPNVQALRSSTAKRSSLPTLRASSNQSNSETTTQADAIRLTARPSVASIAPTEPQSANTVPETANRAQMLIPIDPATLQEFKADSIRRAQAEAEAYARTISQQENIKHGITVNPKMVIPDPLEDRKTTFGHSTPVTTQPMQESLPAIQTSSESIRVSSAPFESLRTPRALEKKSPLPPSPKKILDTQPQAINLPAKPRPEKSVSCDKTGCSSKCQCANGGTCDCQPGQCACKQNMSPLAEAKSPVDVMPLLLKAETTKFDESVSAKIETENQLSALPEELPPVVSKTPPANNHFDPSPVQNLTPPVPAIQREAIPDLIGLPNMAEIEKSLAEFDKANTFDPASIDPTESVDPELLKAKLPGARPSQPAPARFASKTAPSASAEMIAKQLASQQSALNNLHTAIKKLEPKAAAPVKLPTPKFGLRNAAFCTQITGFGQFKPFATSTFAGSQKTLLYCEIENQTSKPFAGIDGSAQHETLLRGSIKIYNASNEVVQTNTFPQIKDVARQHRRDFYVYFPVTLDNLVAGDYRLELEVQDELGNQKSTLTPAIRFSVR